MKYLIVYERTRNNYSAYVPDLPGCVATGRTKRGVGKNIREAIAFHLDGLREDEDEIPEPRAFAEYEEVTVGGE